MVIKIRFIVLGTCTVTDFHSFLSDHIQFILWSVGSWPLRYDRLLLGPTSFTISYLSSFFCQKELKNDITFSENWPHLKGLDPPSHYTVHSFHLLTPARNWEKLSSRIFAKVKTPDPPCTYCLVVDWSFWTVLINSGILCWNWLVWPASYAPGLMVSVLAFRYLCHCVNISHFN